MNYPAISFMAILLMTYGFQPTYGKEQHNMDISNTPLPDQGFTPQTIKKFYKDILEDQRIETFDDYFTSDCLIEINQHLFTQEDFKQRMAWLRNNTKSIKVKVTHSLQSADGTMVADRHISTAVDKQGKTHEILNIQLSLIKNGKIYHFMLVDHILSKDQTTTVHYAK